MYVQSRTHLAGKVLAGPYGKCFCKSIETITWLDNASGQYTEFVGRPNHQNTANLSHRVWINVDNLILASIAL